MKSGLKKDRLWRELKESRREFLTGLHLWPEERLMSPASPEDQHIWEMVITSAVSENRILTAIQQIWNGDPVSVPLGADALERDHKEAERRKRWRWSEVLDEIFWFREETNSTMTWLKDGDLGKSWGTPAGAVTIESLLRSMIRRDGYYTSVLAAMVLKNVHRASARRGLGTAWLTHCCWQCRPGS